MIGRASRAILDFALIVGFALDLVFGRNRRRLRRREAGPARLRQAAECDQRQAVADLTDFAVDFEPTLQLATIVFSERPGERPFVLRWVRRLMVLCQRRGDESPGEAGKDEHSAGNGHGCPQAFTGGGAGAPIGAPSPSTDPAIEFGSGFVRSTLPSTGRMIRK